MVKSHHIKPYGLIKWWNGMWKYLFKYQKEQGLNAQILERSKRRVLVLYQCQVCQTLVYYRGKRQLFVQHVNIYYITLKYKESLCSQMGFSHANVCLN